MHVLRAVAAAFAVVIHAEGSMEPVESGEAIVDQEGSMRPEADSMAEEVTEAGAATEADEECTRPGTSMPAVLIS